jgi:chitinase
VLKCSCKIYRFIRSYFTFIDHCFLSNVVLSGIPSYVGSFTAASSTPDVTEAGSQRTTIYSPIVRPPVGICGAQDCNYVGLIDRGLLSPDGTTGLNGFTRTFDQCSSTPFLFNPSTREFLTYDDPQSVEVKAVRPSLHSPRVQQELIKDTLPNRLM